MKKRDFQDIKVYFKSDFSRSNTSGCDKYWCEHVKSIVSKRRQLTRVIVEPLTTTNVARH